MPRPQWQGKGTLKPHLERSPLVHSTENQQQMNSHAAPRWTIRSGEGIEHTGAEEKGGLANLPQDPEYPDMMPRNAGGSFRIRGNRQRIRRLEAISQTVHVCSKLLMPQVTKRGTADDGQSRELDGGFVTHETSCDGTRVSKWEGIKLAEIIVARRCFLSISFNTRHLNETYSKGR